MLGVVNKTIWRKLGVTSQSGGEVLIRVVTQYANGCIRVAYLQDGGGQETFLIQDFKAKFLLYEGQDIEKILQRRKQQKPQQQAPAKKKPKGFDYVPGIGPIAR